MTGTPKRGVSALIGSKVPPSGRVLNHKHREQHNPPSRIVTGISLPWSSVFSNILATCGIERPTKAIGPHHAVVTAVRRPVTPRTISLVFRKSIPRFMAYFSPCIQPLRGLIKSSEANKPITISRTNPGNSVMLTLLKSPMPQSMSCWNPCAEA